GRTPVEHFDQGLGTSTGGIIPNGLGLGAMAEENSRFYETEGPKIFPKRNGVQKWLGQVRDFFRPRFSNEALRAAVQGVVGDRPLKEATTRLGIPSYDVNTGKGDLFKTPHHPSYLNHADLTAGAGRRAAP